jgi:hypothetical protein
MLSIICLTVLHHRFVQLGFDYMHKDECKQFDYMPSARHPVIAHRICLILNFVPLFYLVSTVLSIFCLVFYLSGGNIL